MFVPTQKLHFVNTAFLLSVCPWPSLISMRSAHQTGQHHSVLGESFSLPPWKQSSGQTTDSISSSAAFQPQAREGRADLRTRCSDHQLPAPASANMQSPRSKLHLSPRFVIFLLRDASPGSHRGASLEHRSPVTPGLLPFPQLINPHFLGCELLFLSGWALMRSGKRTPLVWSHVIVQKFKTDSPLQTPPLI